MSNPPINRNYNSQLRKIDIQVGKQIRLAVSTELVDLTEAWNVKPLTKHKYGYRLRVRNYRVFFDFDGAVRIVSIEDLRKRDERTYGHSSPGTLNSVLKQTGLKWGFMRYAIVIE